MDHQDNKNSVLDEDWGSLESHTCLVSWRLTDSAFFCIIQKQMPILKDIKILLKSRRKGMCSNCIESFQTYSLIFLALLSFHPWALGTKLLIPIVKLSVMLM